MKGEHVELVIGVLIGTVIGGMYTQYLSFLLPVLLGILAVVFGLKFLSILTR